jgi:hypothetical protein
MALRPGLAAGLPFRFGENVAKFGSLAVSRGRPMALRPGLAAGLPFRLGEDVNQREFDLRPRLKCSASNKLRHEWEVVKYAVKQPSHIRSGHDV